MLRLTGVPSSHRPHGDSAACSSYSSAGKPSPQRYPVSSSWFFYRFLCTLYSRDMNFLFCSANYLVVRGHAPLLLFIVTLLNYHLTLYLYLHHVPFYLYRYIINLSYVVVYDASLRLRHWVLGKSWFFIINSIWGMEISIWLDYHPPVRKGVAICLGLISGQCNSGERTIAYLYRILREIRLSCCTICP